MRVAHERDLTARGADLGGRDAILGGRDGDLGGRDTSLAGHGAATRGYPTPRATATSDAWNRILRSLSPRLHRFLLERSISSEAWLARRLVLTRSAATSSIASWLVGVGERSPRSILLESTTAEMIHLHLQPILSQRPHYRHRASPPQSPAYGSDAANASPPSTTANGRAYVAPPPFRLTREVIDALGSEGVHGPFRGAAEAALRCASLSQRRRPRRY